MLRHTPNEEVQARVEPIGLADPAKVRVTPEELVQAMAAIEARREQEARERDGTIAIGEAVRELGLNATPEEILAAVQAQRGRQLPPVTRPRRSHLRRAVLAVTAVMLGLFVARSSVVVAVAPIAPPAEATRAEPIASDPAIDLDQDGRIDRVLPHTTPAAIPPPGSPGTDSASR